MSRKRRPPTNSIDLEVGVFHYLPHTIESFVLCGPLNHSMVNAAILLWYVLVVFLDQQIWQSNARLTFYVASLIKNWVFSNIFNKFHLHAFFLAHP